jgi:hypothetical protein
MGLYTLSKRFIWVYLNTDVKIYLCPFIQRYLCNRDIQICMCAYLDVYIIISYVRYYYHKIVYICVYIYKYIYIYTYAYIDRFIGTIQIYVFKYIKIVRQPNTRNILISLLFVNAVKQCFPSLVARPSPLASKHSTGGSEKKNVFIRNVFF